MRELSGRVNGSLVVLRTTAPGAAATAAQTVPATSSRLLPALRVRDDVAVVFVPDGAIVVDGVDRRARTGHRDGPRAVRGLTLVRVPSAQRTGP